MKVRLIWLVLVVAAVVIGMAAPAAGAGQQVPGGTSETFTDVRADGANLDPSLGRRVRVIPRVTIVEPSSFDWGDAGVGAAGAFGLMLLAAGVVIVSRPGHRSTRDEETAASTGI